MKILQMICEVIMFALILASCIALGAGLESQKHWFEQPKLIPESKKVTEVVKVPDPVSKVQIPELREWEMTVYTSDSCPPCHRLETYLNAEPFWRQNYVVRFENALPGMSTPTIEIHHKAKFIKRIVGFSDPISFRKSIQGE